MELESILLPGIEAKRPIVIAGPCSAETEEQVMDTARQLAAKGQKIFRAGIWKPRTKPGGFEGIGVEGLAWLKEVKKETGMYVSTEVATSVETYIPVSFFTSFNQARPSTPIPSKPPGLVRGFQIPARNIFCPLAASCLAVSITCSSVSALHGPAMTIGLLASMPGNKIDSSSIFLFVFYSFNSFQCFC